jgi:hypothetical protein
LVNAAGGDQYTEFAYGCSAAPSYNKRDVRREICELIEKHSNSLSIPSILDHHLLIMSNVNNNNSSAFSVDGKTALVTGAGSGMGY